MAFTEIMVAAAFIGGIFCGAAAHDISEVQYEPHAVIDRIEEVDGGDIAVIEVEYNGEIYMGDVPVDFIETECRAGVSVPVKASVGHFCHSFNDAEGKTLYQFKSFDGEDWWLLDQNDLGSYKVNIGEPCVLFSGTNGTTECSHEDCECFLYDDFLICLG